jgi:hypothetical protein
MFELNIDFNKFEKSLKKHHVLNSYNHCETIARTSLKTGVDRRTVSLILKNQKQYIKSSSLQLILQQLKRATTRTNGQINKVGKKSLETIMERIANGSTTVNSIIMQLLQLGCIEDLGTQIKLIATTTEPCQNDALQLLSLNIHNCINGFIVQMHCEGNKKIGEL